MIYLINVLGVWLLLAAAFAALAGWALAAEYGAPVDAALRRERDKLVRDLAQLARGEGAPQNLVATDADAARGLSTIRESRIAELESGLAQARSRADGAVAQAAELQRRLDQRPVDTAHPQEPITAIEAHAEPVDEDTALQTWRLRYFEQRVRFLEGRAVNPSAAPLALASPEAAVAAPVMEWRAREAEARANFLAQEARERTAAAPVSAFAANPDVDTLMRWRLLYLERRVAHLQQHGTPLAALTPATESATEGQEKWKWRARYLESRVRHLEQGSPAAPAPPLTEPVADAPPPAPDVPTERPPSLPAAQSGAPDDLTLIEGVSPLQQSALNSLGIFHFDQIAAWTPANVAWVDKYLRLRGRIGEEEWVEQAADLERHGPEAARHLIDADAG